MYRYCVGDAAALGVMQTVQGDPATNVCGVPTGGCWLGIGPITGVVAGSNGTLMVICRRNLPVVSNTWSRRLPRSAT